MLKKWALLPTLFLVFLPVRSADVVPPEIEQPGTQPQEIGNLESPNKCDNCHGGYNSAVEPAHNWRGSMMAHAGRDPIFWATLAIAEQDFKPGEGGAGDLCIRCHSTSGWLAGRSTPTDGSGLAAGDSDGVDCDFCHKLTNPDSDGAEPQGIMIHPFVANEPNPDDPFDWAVDWDPDDPSKPDQNPSNDIEGYYGSGMASMWGGSDKLGPYDDADARHQFMHSKFHRDRDFCGTCHDVSNPAVGDLAHNFGAQPGAEAAVVAEGARGEGRVAFNNPPYKYGVVERTFSEYKAGLISQTLVQDYATLPEELRAGALEAAYNAATKEGTIDPNYTRPSMPRYFSCQTCHMRPVTGKGANKNGVPVRDDLPLHDMTGGNYWMPLAIQYLDDKGELRLGGGMSSYQISAMLDGVLRAKEQLELAATLSVTGDSSPVVRIVNHTGHKLISGYPEGRRMWLNIKWFDAENNELTEHEIGAYGPLTVKDPRNPEADLVVETLRDLRDPYIFEAHMGMTKGWAEQLVGMGYDPNLALSYDRITGDVEHTLGALAISEDRTEFETFHFVLNNTVAKDNRIPPYGMSYDVALVRNALPEPADQYGNPGSGGVYNYWAEVSTLSKPDAATYAEIKLMYQPTSWEYIQFLYLANNGQSPFLADEGQNMLEAWLNTGMAKPHVMASATWGAAPPSCSAAPPELLGVTAGNNGEIVITWSSANDAQGYNLYYDQSGKAQLIPTGCEDEPGCTSFTDQGLTNGQEYCYKVTTITAACESGFSDNILCATASQPGLSTTVPSVVGQTREVAEQWIVEAGLLLGTVGESYSETTAGLVISQSPAADTEVQEGSSVSIVVSLGAEPPAVVCSSITTRKTCNDEPACTWQGKGKSGSCIDLSP